MRDRLRGIAALLLCLGAAAGAAGFERTEVREPCADRDPLRRPHFGDTHVHTGYSMDASALDVRATPADAYRFARGERLGIRPYDETGAGRRSARLERPLDFAMVSDHAASLGEVRICNDPTAPGYASLPCRIYRRWPLLAYIAMASRYFNTANPVRYDFCGEDGATCTAAAGEVWADIQRAAEAAYDRSAACSFTSFVGYEWSGGPGGNMIHRNVVFRNEAVPAAPTGYMRARSPEELWDALERDCLGRGDRCDVLTIPHNSNLSDGALFATERPDGSPIDASHAARRAGLEPLVEISQHKGDSECRLADLETGVVDEACAYEKLPFARMDQQPTSFRWTRPANNSFVREALGEGILQEQALGVNPFKLGIIASTDSHQGTPGLVAEADFPGHGAGGDTAALAPPLMPDNLLFNPGGLAVLWAEENSRDSLFAAMRRREAYGTSGPRMRVRFFGGWDYPADLCRADGFAARGYAGGVPMGGDLEAAPTPSASPQFAVWALRDAGTPGRPGGRLSRAQIVKVWVEGQQTRQRVFDVASAADGRADVDLATCTPRGPGADSLCALWRDPDFDPAAPALYYARLLENPSCRWNQYVCNAAAVDCDAGNDVPDELAACCDPEVPRTIRERAWTSPIWYAPPPGAPAGGGGLQTRRKQPD